METNYKADTVYIKSFVNEISAITEVTQVYTNTISKPIELSVLIPIKPETQLSKFKVTIGNKTVVSKIFSQEKAKEKYTDSIANGNIGVYSSLKNKSKEYEVVIGNLNANETAILTSEFIQMNTSYDMSYEYLLLQQYPNFLISMQQRVHDLPPCKKIEGTIILSTKTKITRLISKNQNPNTSIIQKINPDKLGATITLKQTDRYKNNKGKSLYSSISFLFRTEKISVPTLYAQYDKKRNQTSYILNYIYSSLEQIPISDSVVDEDASLSYYTKYQSNCIYDNPGLFFFLVDQSGSMRGKPIELVKESLLLFFQSLPPRSLFQLIGFGSHYVLYNDKPTEYTKENVDKIMDVIRNMDANLGGTDISSPLNYICVEKLQDYKDINLAKTIFLLTDGFVDDKTTCLDIIAKSSDTFRVQSLGIGQNFDRELIEKCGFLGKGSYSYIENVEQMKSIIIESLNKSLRNYLGDGKVELPEKLNNYKYTYPKEIKVIFEDDVINYGFICPGEPINESIDMTLCMTDYKDIEKKEIKEKISIASVEQIEEGDLLSRIIIGNILRKEELPEEEDIKLSKEYQILSKHTSLFGEIEGDQANTAESLVKVTLKEFDNYPRKFKQPGMPGPIFFPNTNQIPRVKHSKDDIARGFPKGGIPKGIIKEGGLGLKAKTSAKKSGGLLHGMINSVTKLFSSSAKPTVRTAPNVESDKIFSLMAKPVCLGASRGNLDSITVTNSNTVTTNSNTVTTNSNTVTKSDTVTQPVASINDFSELMVTQDIIEGSWNENEQTKKIINMDDMKGIYEKIKERIANGDNKTKICITILILYYILEKKKESINEVKLIIHKAKKFLKRNNVEYDTFITNIK